MKDGIQFSYLDCQGKIHHDSGASLLYLIIIPIWIGASPFVERSAALGASLQMELQTHFPGNRSVISGAPLTM